MNGTVITVRGPIAARELGAVLMHEHLHSDLYDWDEGRLVTEEAPVDPERHKYLMAEAVPLLRACRESHGMGAYVDATMPPWRGWPTLYRDVSQASGVHIVAATGFYREIETDTYFVKGPKDAIWPFVREASVAELADLCVREVVEGIHDTGIRAGVIKLGSSQPDMTQMEEKTFRAGARAQLATGVHITTHCTRIGAETSQLALLEEEGVDLGRVVIGHTASHLMDPECRRAVLRWMARGANFLPTNLGVRDDASRWRPLVAAIHEVFDAGHGDKLLLGLDSGYCTESGPFGPMPFLPPPPFLHAFTHTLPALRELGLTAEEEEVIMRRNPRRVLPVRR